jgi:effector-binding domain-containing protein
MKPNVKVEERGPILVVSRRVPARVSEMGGVLGSSFSEIYGHLEARGVEPAGEPFVIYYDMPENDKPIDIEICAPVARAIEPPRGWKVRELPAGTFAVLVHVGPYDTLGAAYQSIARWIGDHDMVVAGPPREIYLSGPDTPPDQIKTVVEFPVVELGAAVAVG